MSNFKVYDPVAQLIASGGGGGTNIPNSIPGTSIVNNSITNTQLAPGAAVTNITSNSLPGTSIVPGTITNMQIASETITSGNILNGTITGADIASETITTNNILNGTITGADIASETVANGNIVPGAPNTIKGTNSLIGVDDFVLGTGLTLTVGAGPTLAVDANALGKADDTNFGVIEFHSTGDLIQNGANSGIAKIREPPVGQTQLNAGFDINNNFVVSKAGALVGVATANDLPFTFQNLIFQIDDASPRSLKIKLVDGGGYIVGGAQPYWDEGPNDGSLTQFVTGRYIYRNVDTTTFKYLSERVSNEPSGSTLVRAPWDTTLAASQSATGQGYQEIYNFYINDTIDDCGYRVTAMYFNPQSFIIVERLTV